LNSSLGLAVQAVGVTTLYGAGRFEPRALACVLVDKVRALAHLVHALIERFYGGADPPLSHFIWLHPRGYLFCWEWSRKSQRQKLNQSWERTMARGPCALEQRAKQYILEFSQQRTYLGDYISPVYLATIRVGFLDPLVGSLFHFGSFVVYV
jgi:hypothetical protein